MHDLQCKHKLFLRMLRISVVLFLLLLATSYANVVSRIRLSDTEGVIATHPPHYRSNTKSSWFIETNNVSGQGYIRLKFNYFLTECLWDYLHIFNGDSIYSPKLGAYSGEVLEPGSNDIVASSGSGGWVGSGGVVYVAPNEVVLSIDSPHLLLHFFSDVQFETIGFNISYWISSCISNCSTNGVCNEDIGQCQCDTEWRGEYCQIPSCPNNCDNHGDCIDKECHCEEGYTGIDCSLLADIPHWIVQNITNTDTSLLSRAGHTSVLWEGSMWAFGGYQFDGLINNSQLTGDKEYAQLLQYDVNANTWELVEVTGVKPRSRYAHSAVVYQDYMYVYGGSLLPSEEITNELWRFDFRNLNWTEIESCREQNENETVAEYCPIGVKDHSANMVDDRMIILFGYSDGELVNFVQEFDLVNESWVYAPPQHGSIPKGRMAHSSVYVQETGLIYVYGGIHFKGTKREDLSSIIAYDPVTNYWSSDISVGPIKQAFHSTVLINGGLVSYGGYTYIEDYDTCFSSDLTVYDILQDEWRKLSIPGLPGNASRYGYSAVSPDSNSLLIYGGFRGSAYYDILSLKLGRGCSDYAEREECLGSLCRWINNSTCTDININNNDTVYHCHIHIMCSTCTNSTNCHWIDNKCQYIDPTLNTTTSNTAAAAATGSLVCPALVDDYCSYSSCVSCVAHKDCGWSLNGCRKKSNVTLDSCTVSGGCSTHSTCSSCAASNVCLWCPSLGICTHSDAYPFLFPFGQCLGWSRDCSRVGDTCSDHNTCDGCGSQPGCGWCRDEADTGIGSCAKGGFLKSLNETYCPQSHWFYDTCPLCNCNGHSECVNESVCINCTDNTKGTNCESCVDGYYGRPVNGQSCSVCDCNGYNSLCNNVNGTCTCLDAGVTGSTCTLCKYVENYRGNASNICYYSLSVGFIYTFLTPDTEKQNFFVTRPRSGNRLNIKFELSRNVYGSSINIQYFLGKGSQNYVLLYNLSDVMTLSGTESMSNSYQSFDTSNYNSSKLFSFLVPRIKDTVPFSWLLGNSSSNELTDNLWDGDVGLVIYVFDMKPGIRYKITVDQNDLTFLIYFFVTFLTCFTFLLSIFLLGWYIKRKLEIRALIRAQHIEMQRRVRRPFARIKAIVDSPPKAKAKQTASYVAVETVSDAKAAILTVLVRLPSESTTGHPKPNRTGICFGSTFVRMNPPKKKRTKHNSHNAHVNT